MYLNCPSAIAKQIETPASVERVVLPDSHYYYPVAHTASTIVCSHLRMIFPLLFPEIAASPMLPFGDCHYMVCLSWRMQCSSAENAFPSSPLSRTSFWPLLHLSLLSAKVAAVFEETKPTDIPGSLLFLGTGSAVPSKYRNGEVWCGMSIF